MKKSTIVLLEEPWVSSWAIALPLGEAALPATHAVLLDGVRERCRTRAECIVSFLRRQQELVDAMESGRWPRTWRGWHARGYRCVRVRAVLA